MTRTTSATVLATLLAFGGPVAFADTYDYAIDRFEADGNIHGPKDGTPDLVEEFDDGTMGPLFGPATGTVLEASGALHMKSPGTHISIPGVTPTSFEASAVISNGFTGIQVGGGDAVFRIVLPPQTIGGNDGVNFLVSSFEDNALYYAGVSIVNFNTDVAARNHPPVTPGLSILSHQEEINYSTGNEQLILQHAPITAASITGDVVLELRYDDATQTLTSAYSLDGGATFAAPFSPLPVETGNGTASIYLAAVAHDGECPAGLAVRTARFRGLDRPGYAAMNLRAFVGGEQLGYEQVRLAVTDDGAGAATVFDFQFPNTLITTPKCDPRDGWHAGSGTSYKYVNYSNAVPPDCTPGSAQGLRRAQFKWNGTNDIKLKVAKGSLPQIVGPIRVGVYAGTGPVNECDGHIDTASCLVAPGKAKCATATP
jgi:hypothetical protein